MEKNTNYFLYLNECFVPGIVDDFLIHRAAALYAYHGVDDGTPQRF